MTYVLIPGAGGDGWYWHRVVPLLEARGHDVVAVDLRAADDTAGLDAYVDATIAQLGERAAASGDELVVVGQSMGALTAPLVADRLDAALIVLVCPMIPLPGETGGGWWESSGQVEAQRAADLAAGRDPDAPFDPVTLFLHDLAPDVLEAAFARGEPRQSDRPFADPWPLDAWPAIPTRVVVARHDRMFPLDFARRMAEERLNVTPDVVDSGHLPGLAKPDELADLLHRYATEVLPAHSG